MSSGQPGNSSAARPRTLAVLQCTKVAEANIPSCTFPWVLQRKSMGHSYFEHTRAQAGGGGATHPAKETSSESASPSVRRSAGSSEPL